MNTPSLMNESTAATVALSGVGWIPVHTPDSPLPKKGQVVLLWAQEDYWDDAVHVLTGEVHLGEGRDGYIEDYTDTGHSFISHWMPLPAPPATA